MKNVEGKIGMVCGVDLEISLFIYYSTVASITQALYCCHLLIYLCIFNI